ncbi:MAG TPA: hypothetical protein VJ063_01870 [Verrucomicrobiae bacterium]|nr:hypothetical protein [Verrucomicrobiae bacterium]
MLKQETWLSKTKPKPRPTLSWKMVAEDLAAIEITLTNGLKAMDHPQFQAELDYTQGWQLPLRHLGPILRFIDLSVSALSELRQGHLDNAVRRMEAAIQCLGIFGNEPLWVSKVTQSYKAISVFDCTWQAVHANGLQDGHLQRLQDAWRKLDFISDVSRALVMESAIVRHEFARFRGTNQTVYEWLEGKSAPAAPSMAVTAVGRGNATKLVQWLQRRSLLARLEIQLVATG